MEWMLMPYRRYADFSGRSRRKEYWMFVLFQIIVFTVLAVLLLGSSGLRNFDPATGPNFGAMGWVSIAGFTIFGLGSIIPNLAVIVRRLHDQDKSGWLILIQFIPYIGGVVMFVFMCIGGTRGDNRFGSDPKGVQNLGEVFS